MEQEGGVKHSDGTEWPVIADEERALYEILFYSQGPVDGYLLGEGVRDLFLKSGLSLRVLSQIWNLADVSNDNVLNVHEFSLAMHLIRGQLQGLKAPLTLPRKLTPPKTLPLTLSPATPREREAYAGVFHALDSSQQGFLDGQCCRQVLEASGLTSEVLASVWDLCDVTRDGRLDLDEFCVACHLLRYIKAGHSIPGPVDVFTELPNKVDPQSLRARKRRVQQYEQHKQKLMALKEKRRQQVTQENKRLQLQQEKLDLLRQVNKEQKKRGQCQVKEEQFSVGVATHKEEIEKLEEIVYRLKKEHEKVRQETVKIILAEQKLNTDIVTIKKDTDELNRRLGTCHTHASKDPDPFHQLYEQRKEKRQGSTIKDLDKIEVALPFTFNPFDPGLPPTALNQGARLFAAAGKGNNHKGGQWQSAMERLAGFGEGFDAALASSSASVSGEEVEDAVFKEVSVSMDTERWLGFQWGPEDEEGVLGLSGPDTEELQEKLLTLRSELRKLNEPGTRLLFKNPEDYLARKRAKEEEEKEKDRSRFQRRSLTDRRSVPADLSGDSSSSSSGVRDRAPRNRHSYTERNEQVSQAVREYRQKRQSLHSADSADSSASSSPRETRRSSADPDRSAKTPLASDISIGLSAREETVSVSQAVRETPEGRSSVLSELTEEARSAPASRPSLREEKSVLGNSGGGGLEQVSHDSLGKEEAAGELVLDFSAPSAGRVSEERSSKGEAEKVEKALEQQQPGRIEVQQSSLTSFVDKQSVGRESRQQSDSVEKHSTQTTVVSVKSQSSSNKQRSEQPDPDQVPTDPVPRSADPVHKSTDHVQRSTSPESGPGISQTRPSSKKTRAPPPPPASSTSSASPPVPESLTAGRQGPAATAVEAKPAQIVQNRAVTVQSQPAPGQSSSPERPARPKRRKDSGSTSSNPSSPREVPVQPPLLGQARVQNNKVPVATDPFSAPSQPFQLTENVCLEEEAPPTQGTVVLSGKKSSSQKDKSAKKTATVSAQNVVPPLLLNGNGQTPAAASSGQGGSSDPAKQKRRKGKAPEPPASSSAASSPRDVLLSASSTPSPSASPRDAPSLSRPAEEGPSVRSGANPAAEFKAERRKSAKTKAPSPPEQQPRSNPGPKTVQESSIAVPNASQESVPKPPKVDISAVPVATFSTQIPGPVVVQVSVKDPEISKDVALQERGDSATTNQHGVKLANHEDVAAKDVVIIPDSDRGRASETSSICESDAESLPPPLPSSAPPPLPSLPPPSPLPTEVEEVIEVRQVSTTRTLPPGERRSEKEGRMMEEGVLVEFDSLLPDTLPDTADDPQKSMANLRAQFFGLNSTTQNTSNGNKGLMDMDVDELGAQSADSDVSSDDRGMEGTFSPGDSGVVLSSLPTSPDESDSRIQLLSYTTTTKPTSSDIITNSTTTVTVTTLSSSSSSSSQRPQSLSVRESLTTSSGDSLSPTSASSGQQLMSAQDMAALSPRSREIFEKARHFAEMVQPKPTTTTSKREEDGVGGEVGEAEEEEEFSQQTWQDLEMERRAVISQCTPVKKKGVVGVLSPPATPTTPPPPAVALSVSERKEEEEVEVVDFVEDRWRSGEMMGLGLGMGSAAEESFRVEVKEPAAPPAEQSGITHTHTQDSPDRAHSPAEVGWQGKDSLRVNLYSENVLQEPSSTEVVDRESIANLASTRGKWEAIFTSEPKDEPASKPKKTTPKWQVRMPYAEKTCAGPDTVSANNLASEEPESPPPEQQQQPAGVDMESAIEREIRLAVEREEMLRREQEERLRQVSQQSSGGGVKGSSSMESSTESELQPSYHELAEADRGSQFFLNHNTAVHQQQQEEDAESLQKGYNVHKKLSAVGKSDVSATESIIEREIRLQREREAELAVQRGGRVAPSAAAADSPSPSQQPLSPAGEEDGEVEVVLVEEIPYQEAISRYNHDGESRIAQELRELREREEEVRQLRERMHRTSVGGAVDASQQKTSAAPSSPANKATFKPPSAPTTPHGGSKSTPSTPRADKSPTVSFSLSVHNSPRVDPGTPSSKTPTPKPETPIEREIRLARERENELRRSKGLPELKPEPQKQESLEERDKEEVVLTPRHPHYHLSQPDSTMRHFASNRLQQEILVQHDREMKLRQEGKIISTSEEHIQPKKYAQVVAHDQTDGVVVKRNFKTPAARRNSTASQDSNASGDSTPRTPAAAAAHTTPRDGGSGSGKKASAGTGAVNFSYREFAQTAESKIERELREMREREEELRQQRSGGAES